MKYLYQEEVKKLYHLLTKEQQRDLYDKMKSGNIDARDEIIHSCLPLVIDVAKKFRYNNRHIDLEDFIQEGNIALIKAVDNWQIEKGSITTVATWYIRNSFIDMINDAKYSIKTPYSMSRRAAEELRKINAVGSSDIKEISEKTKLKEKKIKKLLSIAPRHQSRMNPATVDTSEFWCEDNEEEQKPCLADLLDLIEENLTGDTKTIFSAWAGIKCKKMGIKNISESFGLSPQYVYDKIKSAQRILKRAASEITHG